jgi:sugar lactone lactonase YvrE
MRPVVAIVLIVVLAFSSISAGQSLNAPESIEYDSAGNRYLISNRTAGNILARAANGTLSVFTEDPTSPAGMEIMQGVVYVADVGRIRGYRLSDAVRVVDYPIPGATFLNGLASSGNGKLWTTDFAQRKLHAVEVSDPAAVSHVTLVQDTVFTPNGAVLDSENDRLLIVTWGANARIVEFRFGDSQLNTILTTTLGNFDGIALGCDNALYFSSWSSAAIKRIALPLSASSISTDLVSGLSNPADISFNADLNEIASPNTGSNSVSFHAVNCNPVLFANGFE